MVFAFVTADSRDCAIGEREAAQLGRLQCALRSNYTTVVQGGLSSAGLPQRFVKPRRSLLQFGLAHHGDSSVAQEAARFVKQITPGLRRIVVEREPWG